MPSNLKHDLRTPLNHIIGYCELLLEEATDQAQLHLVADLERIHFAGRRLLKVINDLFDPIKSAAYKADPSLVHHEIRTPLNQIIGYAEMLQEEARDQGAAAFVADSEKILKAARELLRLVVENFADRKWASTEWRPPSCITHFRQNHSGTNPNTPNEQSMNCYQNGIRRKTPNPNAKKITVTLRLTASRRSA